MIKELRNSFDKEVAFEDLNKAKNYYIPDSDIPCSEDEYLGDDYEEYCIKYGKYKRGLEEAESLEELAEVLNRYSDDFDNGSQYYVKEL